jgi:hypothetical protein
MCPSRALAKPSKGPLMGPNPFAHGPPLHRPSMPARQATMAHGTAAAAAAAASGAAPEQSNIGDVPAHLRRSYKWVTSIADMRSMLSSALMGDAQAQQAVAGGAAAAGGGGTAAGGSQHGLPIQSAGGGLQTQPSWMSSPRSTGEYTGSPGALSPGARTPQRLLSPSPSSKRRAPEPPGNLHTLHEERTTTHESVASPTAPEAVLSALPAHMSSLGDASSSASSSGDAPAGGIAAGSGAEGAGQQPRTEALLPSRPGTPELQGSDHSGSPAPDGETGYGRNSPVQQQQQQQQVTAVPFHLQVSQLRGSTSSMAASDSPVLLGNNSSNSSSSWPQLREATPGSSGSLSGLKHTDSLPNLRGHEGGSPLQRPAQLLLPMDSMQPGRQQQQLAGDQSRRSTRYVLFSPRTTADNVVPGTGRVTAASIGGYGDGTAEGGALDAQQLNSSSSNNNRTFAWQASLQRAVLRFGSSSRHSPASSRRPGEGSSLGEWPPALDSLPSANSSPSQERLQKVAPLLFALSSWR